MTLIVPTLAKSIHLVLSTAAFCVLCLAALQAMLLAIQEKQLHHKRLTGIIQKLPPLQTMETVLFRLMGLGFVLLTGVLITSIVSFENIFAPQLVHKTLFALLAWGMFAGLIVGRYYFGWRGKLAIRGTLGGFIVLGVVYFGSKALLAWLA
jgi:ABC-type uncharacterized transport system permease subunit